MKSQVVMLTAALMLCLTGSAWAQPTVYEDLYPPDTATDLYPPDTATAVTADSFNAPGPQELRSPDTIPQVNAATLTVASGQELRSPDTIPDVRAATPVEPAPAPAATSPAILVPADGGLSAFLIVLISLGGAAALAGAAFGGMRFAHHRAPPA